MINDLERSDDAVSQDVAIHSSSPSLAISPDLNALLEHDERTRQLHSTPPLHFLPPSLSGSHFPVGLPPPPRGNRKVRSRPTTPKESDSTGSLSMRWPDPPEHSPISLSSATSISNPFINAPPKLPQSRGSNERERNNSSASEFSSTLEMSDSLRKAFDSPPSTTEPEQSRDFLHSFPSSASPITAAREKSASPRPTDQPHNSSLRTPSMPRVDKLIGKGKSMFSVSSSQPRSNSQAASTDEEPGSAGWSPVLDAAIQRGFSEFSFQPGLNSKARQPHDSREQSKKNHRLSDKEGGDWAITTVPSRPSSSRSSEEPNKSTRPILSHWSHSWEQSRTRSGSYSSEFTPHTMAVEPRISISSTRYSSSYPKSLYSPTEHPDPVPSRNRDSLAFTSPGRDSFIDSFSPFSPELSAQSDRSFTSSFADASRPTIKHSTETFPFSDGQPLVSPSPSVASSAQTTSHSRKPPIPTTPKPSFKQYSLAHPPPDKIQRKASPIYRLARQPSPMSAEENQGLVPPTTNLLSADERADLVKKSRKLAQVFGTTPGAAVISQKHDKLQLNPTVLPSVPPGKGRHVHGTLSVSGIFKTPTRDNESKSSWPLPEGTQYMTANGRRHSAPLSPDEFPFLSDNTTTGDAHSVDIEIGSQEGAANSDWSSNQAFNHKTADSPTSFMDLSDEDVTNDGISVIMSAETPTKNNRRGPPFSPSTPSLAETWTTEEQEEIDRKRKRDKLAKLHRFLGSRVPVELVLGVGDSESFTPPVMRGQEDRTSKLDTVSEHEDHHKAWLTRRRSSSAAVYSNRSHNLERLKEDLNDEEKAIHVRRAQKMEKVFGVPPPQILYTRHSTPVMPVSPAGPSSEYLVASPAAQTGLPSPANRSRNSNQSAYKTKKRHDRSGTSEFVQRLLPSDASESLDLDSPNQDLLAIRDVYTHYQHSLLSLNDIIDRDDRASLVELHQYLQGDTPNPPLQEFTPVDNSASSTSERRRSLPSSTISISTADHSMPTLKPESTDFQLRRRRAAKLTQFFGVDYKQIIHDVLESIEKGVEEERKRGSLQPEEVEALLHKLRTLRTKRNEIS